MGVERRTNDSPSLNLARRQSDKPLEVSIDVAAAKVAKLRAVIGQKATQSAAA